MLIEKWMPLEMAEDITQTDPTLTRLERADIALSFFRRAYRDEGEAMDAFRQWQVWQDDAQRH